MLISRTVRVHQNDKQNATRGQDCLRKPITLAQTMCGTIWSVNQIMQHASMLSLMSQDEDRNHKLTQKTHGLFCLRISNQDDQTRIWKLRSSTISIVASETMCNNNTQHCSNHPTHAVQIHSETHVTEWTEKTSRLNDNTQDWLIIPQNSDDTLIDKMCRMEKKQNEITQQLPLNRWCATLFGNISILTHQTLICTNTNTLTTLPTSLSRWIDLPPSCAHGFCQNSIAD